MGAPGDDLLAGGCLSKYNIFLQYFRRLFCCPLVLVFLQISHDSFPCSLNVHSSFCLLLRFIPCLWFQRQFLMINIEKILIFFLCIIQLGVLWSCWIFNLLSFIYFKRFIYFCLPACLSTCQSVRCDYMWVVGASREAIRYFLEPSTYPQEAVSPWTWPCVSSAKLEVSELRQSSFTPSHQELGSQA